MKNGRATAEVVEHASDIPGQDLTAATCCEMLKLKKSI
jgi:hypothetical protein